MEFERRLQALQQAGEIPDAREAQITRLKTENAKFKERLAQSEQAIEERKGSAGAPGQMDIRGQEQVAGRGSEQRR